MILTLGQGHDRSALAAVRALAAASVRPIVATAGSASLAAASRYAVPGGTIRTTNLAADIADLAARHRGATIFPTFDDAVIALAPHLAPIVDKAQLPDVADRYGLTTPPTTLYANPDDLLADPSVRYPMVIKPTHKTAGPPAYIAESPDHVRGSEHSDALVAQPFLPGTTEAICGVMWRGRLVAAMHQRYRRTWPVSAGTASFAEVVPADQDLCEQLEALLHAHDGVFQAQFVAGYLVDVNLRVYGSMPLALAAGLNLPSIVCALAGDDTVVAPTPDIGVRYRWVEGDVRHLAAQVRSRTMTVRRGFREAAPRRRVAHSVMAIRDPRPAATRLLGVISDLRRSENGTTT